MINPVIGLDSLGRSIEYGSVVESVALPLDDVKVSDIADLVTPEKPRLQWGVVGWQGAYGIEKLIDSASEVEPIGRRVIENPDRTAKIAARAGDFIHVVLRSAKKHAPDIFQTLGLATLLDLQYLDGPTDPKDLLPHPDWVNTERPQLFILGSVAVNGDQEESDPTTILVGEYTWHGNSRLDENYAKYTDVARSLEPVETKADTMYVGDGRVLLHFGPETVHGPRVLARAYLTPISDEDYTSDWHWAD
ncbi:MAG TPA: hypothetical protein VIH90_05755 [Candidatus Saccharimonadales bacterium]